MSLASFDLVSQAVRTASESVSGSEPSLIPFAWSSELIKVFVLKAKRAKKSRASIAPLSSSKYADGK